MVIKKLIVNRGYQYTIANNGDEAIEKWKNGQFSVILMDLKMPVKDGFQATTAIREIEKNELMNEIPIIALTASTSKEEVTLALSCGMNDYLNKPIRANELDQAIWRALNTKLNIKFNPARRISLDEGVKSTTTARMNKVRRICSDEGRITSLKQKRKKSVEKSRDLTQSGKVEEKSDIFEEKKNL